MYQATLLKLSQVIEEEIFLDINGVKLVGFSTICPYEVFPNNIYSVNLYFTFIDQYEIEELNSQEYGIERIEQSYRYIVKGEVIDDSLCIGSGIKIQDDYFKDIHI